MKILEKLATSARSCKSSIGAGLLSLAMIINSGCAMQMTSQMLNQRAEVSRGVYFDLDGQAFCKVSQVKPNLSIQDRTVTVHPADGGPSRGEVVLDYGDSYNIPSLGASYSASIGTRSLIRAKAGIEGRWNLSWDYDGCVEQKLQPLPRPYESYGYSAYKQNEFAYKPFVGVDLTLFDHLRLGVEFGRPSGEFDYEIGDYRWDTYTPRYEKSWKGMGKSFTKTIGFVGDGFGISISEDEEEYGSISPSGKNAEIKSWYITFIYPLDDKIFDKKSNR
jgi:hypothetical protein